jgi:hypothetical protein
MQGEEAEERQTAQSVEVEEPVVEQEGHFLTWQLSDNQTQEEEAEEEGMGQPLEWGEQVDPEL